MHQLNSAAAGPLNFIHEQVSIHDREIHISDVRTFNTCRLKWYWMSPHGRRLRPVAAVPALWLGTGVHDAIRRWHQSGAFDGGEGPQDFFTHWIREQVTMSTNGHGGATGVQSLRENIESQSSLGISMLEGYRDWFMSVCAGKIEFIDWEREFRVPIVNSANQILPGACLAGRIDAVAKVGSALWLVEYKTTAHMEDFEHSLMIDNQCSAYQYAAWMLGHEIKGTVYILLRKKAPDWTQLDGKCYRMMPIKRSQPELVRFADDLYAVSSEMMRPDVPIWPAPSPMTCRGCAFWNPCTVRMSGSDPSQMLNANFRMEGDR